MVQVGRKNWVTKLTNGSILISSHQEIRREKRWRRDRKQYADTARLWQINTYSIFLHIPPCSKFNKHCQTWKYLPRNRPIKPKLVLFFAKEWLVVCVIQYTQSFRNFVIFDCLCNWKKNSFSVPLRGWFLRSCIICWPPEKPTCVCVTKCV